MQSYIAIGLLFLIGGASFGFGRYTAPPHFITETVYRDGDLYPGQYFSLANAHLTNVRIVVPKDTDTTHWNFSNNIFMESGTLSEMGDGNVVIPTSELLKR